MAILKAISIPQFGDAGQFDAVERAVHPARNSLANRSMIRCQPPHRPSGRIAVATAGRLAIGVHIANTTLPRMPPRRSTRSVLRGRLMIAGLQLCFSGLSIFYMLTKPW